MDPRRVEEVVLVAQADLEGARDALGRGVGSGTNRVVVDWDGTCVEAVWPDMGEWLPNARESLHLLLDMGFEVEILSTRLAPVQVDEETPRPEQEGEIALVRKMLDEAGLDEVGIWLKPWKPGAVAYLDDKAIHIDPAWPVTSWERAVRQLRRYAP